MARVALVECKESPLESVRQLTRLCGADVAVPRGAKVLVKPNLHGGHGHTAARVIGAVCMWAYEQGAAHVYVGDGPFWGCSAEQADDYFRGAGLHEAAAESGAEVVNLHTLPYRILQPDDPALPDRIGVSSLLFECDVVINLPLLKTHFNTLMTLGIKNLKGCIRPQDKRRFHEMELNAAVAALCRLIAPRISVTLLDATTAVEGMGPAAGTEIEMGLLAASADIVAVDSVACYLAGIDPSEVRLIRDCAQAGLGEMDLSRIRVAGEDPARHRRRFRRPNEEIAEHFPGLQIVTDGACSGCAMNLLEALASIHQAGESVRVPAVAIGGRSRILAGLTVGNCTQRCEAAGEHLDGCPPSTEEIRRALCQQEGS